MRNAVFRDVLVVYSSKKGGEEPHVLLAGTRFAIAPAMTTQSDNVTNQHTLRLTAALMILMNLIHKTHANDGADFGPRGPRQLSEPIKASRAVTRCGHRPFL